ncbi:hypothetical protein F2Q68_00016117 [Brassica cretica]|nr:hypothetical protein F2Q68_00016117 [Brassica cretica]KAF3610336.1 hypothetical protein DY000_02048642 [Brassica cretica]
MLGYMVEDDEQYGSGEPSRVEEADTRDPASQSIDITTSPLIDTNTSTSIDTISCCQSTPLEIHDISICFRDSVDSTQKSTAVSSCDLVPDVDKEITIEDFLELEDEAQPENVDHNLEKKLDDHQHTSEKDLETSPEACIDRQHPVDIDRHPPDDIDRHPWDHLSGQKKLLGFTKESMQLSSYIEVLDDHQHVEASQRGLRFRDVVDKGPPEAASIDTGRIPSNNTTDAISNDINKSESIETTTSPSINTRRVTEQKEFDVCGNLVDGETTI